MVATYVKKENTTTTLFVYEKPKSTISEKFRGIRSNIMFSKANGEVKRLLGPIFKSLCRKVESYSM